jgi:hypothetical protein
MYLNLLIWKSIFKLALHYQYQSYLIEFEPLLLFIIIIITYIKNLCRMQSFFFSIFS